MYPAKHLKTMIINFRQYFYWSAIHCKGQFIPNMGCSNNMYVVNKSMPLGQMVRGGTIARWEHGGRDAPGSATA